MAIAGGHCVQESTPSRFGLAVWGHAQAAGMRQEEWAMLAAHSRQVHASHASQVPASHLHVCLVRLVRAQEPVPVCWRGCHKRVSGRALQTVTR